VQDYRVQLDVYQGPLDLLLYLIRREEVDIYDIPIARITEQFLAYVDMLRQIDPNVVGDFLVMAATLMEIKSRMLLPRPPAAEGEEELVDPRQDLVRQLLEYKRFRDAAAELAEAAAEQSRRFPRPPLAPRSGEVELELEDVQIWDLLTAFNALLCSIGRPPAAHEIVYDDTPVSLHAADIQDRLERENGSLTLDEIFAGRSRAEMIGLFLALLELIRQKRVRAEQDRPFGTIIIHLLDPTPITEASLDRAGEPAPDEADGSGEPPEASAAGEHEFGSDEDDREDEFARLIDRVNADAPIETDLPDDGRTGSYKDGGAPS